MPFRSGLMSGRSGLYCGSSTLAQLWRPGSARTHVQPFLASFHVQDRRPMVVMSSSRRTGRRLEDLRGAAAGRLEQEQRNYSLAALPLLESQAALGTAPVAADCHGSTVGQCNCTAMQPTAMAAPGQCLHCHAADCHGSTEAAMHCTAMQPTAMAAPMLQCNCTAMQPTAMAAPSRNACTAMQPTAMAAPMPQCDCAVTQPTAMAAPRPQCNCTAMQPTAMAAPMPQCDCTPADCHGNHRYTMRLHCHAADCHGSTDAAMRLHHAADCHGSTVPQCNCTAMQPNAMAAPCCNATALSCSRLPCSTDDNATALSRSRLPYTDSRNAIALPCSQPWQHQGATALSRSRLPCNDAAMRLHCHAADCHGSTETAMRLP